MRTPAKRWLERGLFTIAFLYSCMCLLVAGVDQGLGRANVLTYAGMVTHTIFMATMICWAIDGVGAWQERRKVRREQRELRRRPVRLRLVENKDVAELN
jgi:hypothetical protein